MWFRPPSPACNLCTSSISSNLAQMVKAAFSCFCTFPVTEYISCCLPWYSTTCCLFLFDAVLYPVYICTHNPAVTFHALLTIFPHLVQTTVKFKKNNNKNKKKTNQKRQQQQQNKEWQTTPLPPPTPNSYLLIGASLSEPHTDE